MKRRILFFLYFSLALGVNLGLFWLTNRKPVVAQNNSRAGHPLASVNSKAKIARDGNQTNAEAYVGEIIAVSGLENELRGFTSNSIKDRVGRAESRYRLGESPGIPEAKIVRTVNGLARKLNMPGYVRTSEYEVRRLRLGLLPNFPQVISQKNQGSQPVDAGSQIDPQMSPAEAVFVLSMMMQQKLANPEYQLTRTELLNRWTETHNHGAEPSGNSHPAQNRSREVRDALKQAARSMSMSTALQLSNMTLNTLGIEQ